MGYEFNSLNNIQLKGNRILVKVVDETENTTSTTSSGIIITHDTEKAVKYIYAEVVSVSEELDIQYNLITPGVVVLVDKLSISDTIIVDEVYYKIARAEDVLAIEDEEGKFNV